MNQSQLIAREEIIRHLVATFEPLGMVYAMWEGGAAANNRIDEWSDIDLQLDVADDFADAAMQLAETALLELSSIARKYIIPQPSWHGHLQTFFLLANTSPFLLIDLVVIKNSHPNKFIETEIHGHPVVHFDKKHVVVPAPLDVDEMAERILDRLESLKSSFEMFQVLTEKEINRGNFIEAISFYYSFTLRPLIEALRIIYKPWQYNFYTRYIYYDFPPEIIKTLESLYCVDNPEHLLNQYVQAVTLFREIAAQISVENLKHTLHQQQNSALLRN